MADTVLHYKGKPITDLSRDELVNALTWAVVGLPPRLTKAANNAGMLLRAEPEPEGPTDEEIMDLMPQQMRDDLAAAARAMSGFDPDNIKAASVFRIILNRHSVDHARAVLARWGRPAPIPVTERLPKAEDCDAEGMCWWYCAPAERWLRCGIPEPDPASQVHTHWLPANALPLPKEVA